MTKMLESLVDPHNFATTLLIIIIIAYFAYKEWPEFRKRVSKKTEEEKDEEAKDLSFAQQIESLQKCQITMQADIASIKERQARDYQRLNDIEAMNMKQNGFIRESLEERNLLMEGIISCLDGLEQLGANHKVTETKDKIHTYLNNLAHKNNNQLAP